MSAADPLQAGYSNTKALGERLYTEYFLLPFEVAASDPAGGDRGRHFALTLRKRPEVRRQNPAFQVRVKRDERMRLVKWSPRSRQRWRRWRLD